MPELKRPEPTSERIPKLDTATVLGYEVAHCTLQDAARWSVAQCRHATSPKLLVTLNPEIVVRAEQQPDLRGALQQADLTVADGVGITWAARRSGVVLPERVPGVELMARILDLGGADLRVYFLGAKPGVAARAAEVARERYGVRVAGTQHGYFERPGEVLRVIKQVAASKPHLLLAGLGEGQELFLHAHRHAFNVPLMMGVGGALERAVGRGEAHASLDAAAGARVGLPRRL